MPGIAAVLRDVTKRFEEVRALRKELAAQQETTGHQSRAPSATGGPPRQVCW